MVSVLSIIPNLTTFVNLARGIFSILSFRRSYKNIFMQLAQFVKEIYVFFDSYAPKYAFSTIFGKKIL